MTNISESLTSLIQEKDDFDRHIRTKSKTGINVFLALFTLEVITYNIILVLT